MDDRKINCADLKKFGLCYWMICADIVFAFICVVCFCNFASNYYQVRFDYRSAQAGQVICIVFAFGVVVSTIIGCLVDKIGRRPILIIVAAVFLSFFCCVYALMRKLCI